MTQTDTCPEPKSLLLLASGQLPAEDVERLAKHLESCVRCVETLTGLKAEDTLADAVRAAADTGEITPSTAVRELMNRLKSLREESEPRTAATLPPTGDDVQPDRSHDLLAPAQSVDEIGRLGPYRVIRELGGGGMGTVFLAEDPQLQRLVALKTMNPSLAASAAARERFLREARATAKVKHDHVVTIHQVGEDRSIPFIAMELLEGETLDARLKRELRLPCSEVLRIGQEIARGLAAAHKRGLLHRDIKPANIWLEAVSDQPSAISTEKTNALLNAESCSLKAGRVKIVDFGLARAASGDAQLTQEGAIIGTPAYMAPEQATNTNVDHRCDLFSLGCVLYRMAAGVPAFKGTDTISTLMSVATDQPTPPHLLNSQLPRPVSDYIMNLLEKSPEKRPASAQEVAERLREMSRTLPLPSPPLRRREVTEPLPQPLPEAGRGARRRRVLGAVGLLVLALGVLGWFYGGTIIRIATNEGELVIETNDPSIEITIHDGQAKIHDKVKDRRFILKAGKDYEVTVIEDGPDGLRVATKKFQLNRGGKEIVNARMELAKAKPILAPGLPADPDRRAAEWVLSIGGGVYDNVQQRDFRAARELPKEAFRLTTVYLLNNPKATDAGMANFKDCTNLTHLHLAATRVTDAGLANFKDAKNLAHLTLGGTGVTDAGLANFHQWKDLQMLGLNDTQVTNAGLARIKDCKKLTTVYLHNTRVSDAGLEHLSALLNLTDLSLQNTKVTAAGVQKLAAALPRCKIESDHGTFGPTTADGDRRAAEWVLSVGGWLFLSVDGKPVEVKRGGSLPGGRFLLVDINLDGMVTKGVNDAALEILRDVAQLGGLRLAHLQENLTNAGLARLASMPAMRDNLNTLVLHGTSVSDAGLVHLKQFAKLQFLDVSATAVTGAGLVHLRELKNLNQLHLANVKLTDAELVPLKELTNLGIVTLINTQIGDAGLEVIAGWPKLYDLRLQGTKVTEAGVKKLAARLPKCKIEWDGGVIEPSSASDPDRRAAEWTLRIGGHLEILQGDRVWTVPRIEELPTTPFRVIKCWAHNNKNVTDDGLSALRGVTGTLDLNFDDTPITDTGLVHLKDCKGVWALHLAGTKISGDGLKHLAGLSKLDELWLDRTPLTSAGLAHLKDLPSLHALGLSDTRVDDAVFQHLPEPLRGLRLSKTKVTDAGLAVLKSHKQLTELDIQQTEVTDVGLKSLEAVKSLELLDATQTKVTILGVKKLAAALPKCKIVSDHGTFEPDSAGGGADDFVPVFNGKNLDGWESERGLEKFSVDAEGNLRAAGDTPAGSRWLLTKQDYSDFVLRLDFSFVHPGLSNSGVTIRSLPALTGAGALKLEINIRSAAINPWTGAVVFGLAAKQAVVPKEAPALKPAGDWNSMEIEAVGTRLKVSINGKLVNDVDLSQVDRSTLSPKERGAAEANLDRKGGRIGLQSLNAPMKFRNIRIKDLSKLAPGGHGTFGPTASPDSSAELTTEQRQALEWVQSVGGLIRVVIDGKHVEVFPRQQIPRRPLRVYWVNLRGIRRVNDTTLEKLKAAPPIRQVYLDGTAITNAGLAKLATYPGFARLRILNVTRTALTDAGLEHVARFTALDILRAGETKITAAGVSKLSAALPRCKVAWDGVPTEVKPAIDEPTGFTNALGMEFALVPKGKAWMGGMAGTHGNSEVELKEDFYLGVYEVTQEEWQQIMGVNPSEYTRTGKEKELVKDLPDADLKRLPVTHVSWNDCQEFIARLNERTKESGWVYRLPKAEEWQYAFRGGSLPKKEDYAFDYYFDRPTNTLLPDRANFNNTLKRPAKVGSYPPNALGLYDMHGNMAELLDEALPEGKWGPHTRVTRGGGFSHPAEWCRTVFHITTPHNARFHDIGLRLARVKK